jgi:hypothetical protein
LILLLYNANTSHGFHSSWLGKPLMKLNIKAFEVSIFTCSTSVFTHHRMYCIVCPGTVFLFRHPVNVPYFNDNLYISIYCDRAFMRARAVLPYYHRHLGSQQGRFAVLP